MEEQTFNGITFRRDEHGYFRQAGNYTKTMHRYVWEFYNGDIPKGYEVHHIDSDRSNNDISNLQLLGVSEHKKLHGKLLTADQREWRRNNLNTRARPKAIEWHGSKEGIEWHSAHLIEQHAKGEFKKKLICTNCGKQYIGEKNGKNTFCCNACKSAYRRKMKLDCVERICPICGKAFMTNKYKHVITCGKSCANRYKWRIKHESEIGQKDEQGAVCV